MSFTSNDTARFASDPFIVFYETTRACDLVCRHCRACAQPCRHPNELDTHQSKALLAELARRNVARYNLEQRVQDGDRPYWRGQIWVAGQPHAI